MSQFIVDFAYILTIIATFVISIFIIKDLRAIPQRLQEHFGFSQIGYLGGLGALLIVLAVFYLTFSLREVFDLDSNIFYYDTLESYFWNYLRFVLGSAFHAFAIAWMGALCLYARYRLAANKRLAAISLN